MRKVILSYRNLNKVYKKNNPLSVEIPTAPYPLGKRLDQIGCIPIRPSPLKKGCAKQDSTRGKSRVPIWSFILIFYLVTPSYASPCYGTKLPKKKQFFTGFQTHTVFKRYLKDEHGKLRSMQHFALLSYGVYDWLSIDLKSGTGFIKQHPVGSDEVDYPSGFSGGYGFRIKPYDRKNLKIVFGFQHISVHSKNIYLGDTKHKAVLDDWQVSFLLSQTTGKITPYLGTKWSRCDYIHWIEESRKRKKSDLTKSIGLILGFDFSLTQRFWFNLEGQLFDSEALAFSVNFSF